MSTLVTSSLTKLLNPKLGRVRGCRDAPAVLCYLTYPKYTVYSVDLQAGKPKPSIHSLFKRVAENLSQGLQTPSLIQYAFTPKCAVRPTRSQRKALCIVQIHQNETKPPPPPPFLLIIRSRSVYPTGPSEGPTQSGTPQGGLSNTTLAWNNQLHPAPNPPPHTHTHAHFHLAGLGS